MLERCESSVGLLGTGVGKDKDDDAGGVDGGGNGADITELVSVPNISSIQMSNSCASCCKLLLKMAFIALIQALMGLIFNTSFDNMSVDHICFIKVERDVASEGGLVSGTAFTNTLVRPGVLDRHCNTEFM